MHVKGLWQAVVAALWVSALLSLPSVSTAPATADAQTAKPGPLLRALGKGALATFDVNGERFRVWTVNLTTIGQLKALMGGTSNAHIPNGRILRGAGKAGFNQPWGWHLDPRDVEMAEVTMEGCDGRPSYVKEHLDEFVDVVKRYCPWSARLISLRVIPSAPTAPTGLRITSVKRGGTSTQRTTVLLRWQDRSANETGFRLHATFTRLYGRGDGQSWEVGANITRARVTFVAGGINPIRMACFAVSAVNAAAESVSSGRACIRP